MGSQRLVVVVVVLARCLRSAVQVVTQCLSLRLCPLLPVSRRFCTLQPQHDRCSVAQSKQSGAIDASSSASGIVWKRR